MRKRGGGMKKGLQNSEVEVEHLKEDEEFNNQVQHALQAMPVDDWPAQPVEEQPRPCI
jgi:hypothetical protein